MAGRGSLVIIGGHEERDPAAPREILRRVAELVAGGTLILCTVASSEPAGYVEEYTAAFADLGLGRLVPWHPASPGAASDRRALAAIDAAAGVFFTGGDQVRLMAALGGTPVVARLRALLARGGVVAGTSAGASAMSVRMIARGPGSHSPHEGEMIYGDGLGLFPHAVIDQHFAERGRMGRLLAAVAELPDSVGLGIDENTAVLARDEVIEVLGSGGVTVVEGGEVRASPSRVADVLTITGARVHLLGQADRFDTEARRLL